MSYKETEARDSGAEAVLNRAGETWRNLAEFFVYRYLQRAGAAGALFEEARDYAEKCFEATPPSPNAWGALALRMASNNIIVRTGYHRQSHHFSNHSRQAAEWRVNPHQTLTFYPNPFLAVMR